MRLTVRLAFAASSLALLVACPQSGGPIHVDRCEPPQGTTAGGEAISIIGGGFVPGKTQAEVRFGRKKAENVIIASSEKITVVSPNGEKGPIDVSVMFDGGESFKIPGGSPGGFRYVEPTANESARKAFFGGAGDKKPAGGIELEKKAP